MNGILMAPKKAATVAVHSSTVLHAQKDTNNNDRCSCTDSND